MSSKCTPITTFFSSTKTIQLNDKNNFVASKSNEIINKTLNEDGDKNNTENDGDVRILREKINVLQNQLKQAKMLLRKANDVNMQKDIQITALKQQLKNIEKKVDSNKLLFENHVHQFESNDIKKIRSIKAGQQHDSAFILNITRALYRNEENKLQERQATSRKYKKSTKSEISADKKEIMRQMFEERVVNESETGDEYDETAQRLRKLNTHVRHALKNSVTAIEKKKKQSQSSNVVSTKSTSVGIAPVFSQANYFASTPAVYSPSPALQNTDNFHSFQPASYPFSPIYSDPPYQHTPQSLPPPSHCYPYYSQNQSSPMQTNWTQNRQF